MLLNKFSLAVASIASKEESRYSLPAIHVTKAHTEATNGHIALRVTHPAQNLENYPEVGQKPLAEDFTETLVSADDAKSALKNVPQEKSLTMLNHAHFGQNGTPDSFEIVTSDLSQVKRINCQKVEGKFPDINLVIPSASQRRAVTVALNAKSLIELLKPLCAMSDEHNHCVEFTVYSPNTVVKIESRNIATGQNGMGLIMPLNLGEAKRSQPDSKSELFDKMRTHLYQTMKSDDLTLVKARTQELLGAINGKPVEADEEQNLD